MSKLKSQTKKDLIRENIKNYINKNYECKKLDVAIFYDGELDIYNIYVDALINNELVRRKIKIY